MPAHILARMPQWFIAQHRAIEKRERQRREIDLVHSSLDLINGADVKDSGWHEWEETMASMQRN